MSTRSTTHFRQGGETCAIVYRHADGYPSGAGADILTFFEAVEAQTTDIRFTDPDYLAAKYVVFLAAEMAPYQHVNYRDTEGDYMARARTAAQAQPLNFLSVGVCMSDPFDIEYRYLIDCDKLDADGRPTVQVTAIGWGDCADETTPLADAIAADKVGA